MADATLRTLRVAGVAAAYCGLGAAAAECRRLRMSRDDACMSEVGTRTLAHGPSRRLRGAQCSCVMASMAGAVSLNSPSNRTSVRERVPVASRRRK